MRSPSSSDGSPTASRWALRRTGMWWGPISRDPSFLQFALEPRIRDSCKHHRAAFSGLLAAARGCLRSVTLAPELPGALDLIVDIVGAGAVAAIGHTDGTYTDAQAAIETG